MRTDLKTANSKSVETKYICPNKLRVPFIRSWKISWLFTDFGTIFTDLKLAMRMIKNTQKPLIKSTIPLTSLKSIIFRDAFLTKNLIPCLFTDFYKLLRFSLTFYKIPWLFPDLRKFLFFPDRGNPEANFRLSRRFSPVWLVV